MQTVTSSQPKPFKARDIGLDVLRGCMLIIMAMDHFGEPIMNYTWEMVGFVSAAEGFVFLSGLLVGLIYGRYTQREGAVLEHKLWQRAGVIYGYHWIALFCVFLFTLISVKLQAPWQSYAIAMEQMPWRAWISGMLLIYQPPMLDILPLYISLMLFAPIALRLMSAGGIWWVVVGSVLIWIVGQFDVQKYLISQLALERLLVGLGSFDLLGWQLLFVLGMSIGYDRYRRKGEPRPIIPWLWIACTVIVIGLFFLKHEYFTTGWLELYDHTDRESVAWLRLINFLAVAYMIAGIMQMLVLHIPQFFKLRPVQWLAFLGRHSLQVFAFHLVLLYCYIPFRWGEYGLTDNQKWLVLGVFLISLSLPAWVHQQAQQAKGVMKAA